MVELSFLSNNSLKSSRFIPAVGEFVTLFQGTPKKPGPTLIAGPSVPSDKVSNRSMALEPFQTFYKSNC